MTVLLDTAGAAPLAGDDAGRPRRNEWMFYPADPATVAKIVAVSRRALNDRCGWGVGPMIVVLGRVGLRIREARNRRARSRSALGSLVHNGKGGRCREVGTDPRRPGRR